MLVARDLVTHPVQHAPVHVGEWGGGPGGVGGVLDDVEAEVVVEVQTGEEWVIIESAPDYSETMVCFLLLLWT
jgi:hypothetical protein